MRVATPSMPRVPMWNERGLARSDQVALHRLVDALHLQRRLRLDVEHPAHQRIGVVADAQRAGRRSLFHAGGDVDRDAADGALGIDAAAQQHAAGVDADAHVEAYVAVRGLHFAAEHAAELEQRQTAAHRALGIVLAGIAGTEHRQQVVAGV